MTTHNVGEWARITVDVITTPRVVIYLIVTILIGLGFFH